MYSMTGYGKGTACSDGRELTVELKSVNHRFLDVGLRLPRQLCCIEDSIRKQLSLHLSRGHIDVYVNYRNTRNDARAVSVDAALLSAYVAAAKQANEQLGLVDDLTLSAALKLPDVTEIVASDEDAEALIALSNEAVLQAVTQLKSMRLQEGERLKEDLYEHLTAMNALIAAIAKHAPAVCENYRKRLFERIEAVLESGDIDRARLATEIALFADRSAIDEELARLKSHREQFELLLSSDEPAGRKLDFIVQEMNRECNTIGSKANDGELTQLILQCKCEIEKLREQLQNIE
ncbi:MAG: YicC/YloC family endoribonuclease [Clostridia bacterium]|nr:YicC/YloC family endoribonuclease [Clostridia bacterium]